MAVSDQITRITNACNSIKEKLVDASITSSSSKIDVVASDLSEVTFRKIYHMESIPSSAVGENGDICVVY